MLLLVTFRAFSAVVGARSLLRVVRRLFFVAACLFAYTGIGFLVLQDDFTPTPRSPTWSVSSSAG